MEETARMSEPRTVWAYCTTPSCTMMQRVLCTPDVIAESDSTSDVITVCCDKCRCFPRLGAHLRDITKANHLQREMKQLGDSLLCDEKI